MRKSISHLNIGPVRFVLHGEADLSVHYDAWGYRNFFAGQHPASEVSPLAQMEVQLRRGSRNLPSERPLYESGRNWAVWPDGDDHWLFCSRYADRDRPYFTCRVARSLEQATLMIDGDPAVDPLRYPLDQILAWGLLARCGGVVVHSALVARQGAGLVLAGRSGAGKSTLAEICREKGWVGLNDDRVILYQRDGRPLAAGTPWHGTGRLAEAGEVRPVAIILLAQAETERLEKVSPQTARLELLDVTSIPWFEDEWAGQALDALDAMVESVPAYRFCFTPNPVAADVLEECLQEELAAR